MRLAISQVQSRLLANSFLEKKQEHWTRRAWDSSRPVFCTQNGLNLPRAIFPHTDRDSWDYDQLMRKKTGISDRYLWATTLALMVLGAWMFIKK